MARPREGFHHGRKQIVPGRRIPDDTGNALRATRGQWSTSRVSPRNGEWTMPTIKVNDINLCYDEQGAGEPLVMIPYLAADYACYAFQVSEYAKHFKCISVSLRGTGDSDKPAGPYSMELFADDVAAFMQALGIEQAHVSGLSLGAATGMWLAAKYPEKVKSLSLHSAWPKTDPFLTTIVEGWQTIAKALDSVPEMIILGILPWCLTPELYAAKPDYVQSLADFVRSRPAQPLEAFMACSNAVIAHDAEAQLGKIKAPTQITFGQRDSVTSTRFAEPMHSAIKGSEVVVFEGCAHAPIYEKVDEFNQTSLAFLQAHVN
jgi:3-oxoadipate enol-lactonase